MSCAGLCLAALLAIEPSHAGERLEIDASHTAVVFSWNHRGFSHPLARLEKVAGTVRLDRADLTHSSVTATMALDGLRTGDADLDRRLRGKSFFDISQYPAITFKSTKVEIIDSTNRLRIVGDLCVHGITRTVVLDAHINRMTESTVGFDADATLRRSDFDLGRYVPMVSDELTVHITLEAAVS
jgi:polyisoprenoid-binding protein YceI